MSDHPPAEDAGGAGEIVGAVAGGLGLGMAWELLVIQTDWRLGFSPPVWEIVVGWLGFSAFIAFAMMIFTVAAVAFYATSKMVRNPQSWDARQSVLRAKRRAAAFVVGAGGLAVIGGLVIWGAGKIGPEFEGYVGFARFTIFLGIAGTAAAVFYLRKDPDPTP